MKIYKNFHLHKNTILVRELKDGIVSKYKIPLKPSYYFVTDKPSQYKSIYGDNLIKMDFNNSFEAKEWADMYKTQQNKIFGFPHSEYIKIHELFPGDLSKQFNINDFNVSIIDIETQAEGRVYPLSYQMKVKNKITDEISTLTVYDFEHRDTSKYLVMQSNDWVEYNTSIYYPKGAWPDHESANEEINLISLSIKGPSNKKNKGFFIKTFGTKDVVLDAEDAKDTEYVNCSNEKELLKEFVEYWTTLDIDFVSGWNCIPVTQSVWLQDKITTMGNLSNKDRNLYDSLLVTKFPTTKKEEVITTLSNGKVIKSSKDHIFPYVIKDKSSYVQNIYDLPRYEGTIESISKISTDKEVYFINALHDNKNNDLTFRKLITNNLDLLTNNGLDICVRTTTITRILSKVYASDISSSKKKSLFNYSNLINYIDKEVIINEINKMNNLLVRRMDGTAYVDIDLNKIISSDDMWFTGLWYTDGTNSYKTEITITNTNKELMYKLASYLNKDIPNSREYKTKPNAKPYYSIITNLNSTYAILLKPFIYDSCNIKSKKDINIELLSQLSYNQFMAFMAGCIDGDGSIRNYDNGKKGYTLCNYNNNIEKFHELLEWNGIYCSMSDNLVSFKAYLPCISHSGKIADSSSIYSYSSDIAKSKNISKQILPLEYYSRLKNIDFTDNLVEMADIQTNTHYFYTKGTLTHNCTAFDMPYLIKRIVHVLGDEYVKNLSPWKIINTKKTKNDYGKEITLFDIVGISQLDFLLLYKKFSQNEAENYKLDYIANLELDDKKVEYDCSFRELYTKHYDLFTKYNIHDVRLVGLLEKKLGFIALACTMLYRAKVTAPDVFTTVRIWDVIITNYTADRNIFVPAFLSDNSSAGSYGGGYVKDPIVGFYKWLLSIDATSLYPSIERTLNTSPETILNSSEFIKITPLDILNNTPLYLSAVDNAKQKNASLAANGALFSNEKQGIIPALNEMYFNERVVEKSLGKQYEKAASKISKILESRGVSV